MKPTPATSSAPDASSRGYSPDGSFSGHGRRRACLALAALGCAPVARALPGPATAAAPPTRLARLDPDRIDATAVRDVLAHLPAPRIIALQGSLAPVTMRPLAEFLIAMGYPRASLAHPRDDALSQSSFGSSAALAGSLAWYCEREGMVPLLIGHSQGGMLAIRTLHELAGAFATEVPVWNPLTDAPEPRTTFVDPATAQDRPVLGLRVPWACALATGKLPRLVLGQWSMLTRLTKIPDTVVEFTGYAMAWDPIAGNFGNVDPYVATGTAAVKNVLLPSSYHHVALPDLAGLAEDATARTYIDGYQPGSMAPEAAPGVANLVHAADIWHSVKKHWCREAQRSAAAASRSGAG